MADQFDPKAFLGDKGNDNSTSFSPDDFLSKSNKKEEDQRQAKYGTFGQQAISGLEGTARGISIGLSDQIETKLLNIPATDIQGRKEANPFTSNATEILGNIGLTSLTGGLVNPAEAFLGKGIGTIAGLAAEGGILGAGNAISEQALGDPDMTAEKVAAHVGLGSVIGGTFGLLGKGLEATIPKVKGRLNELFTDLKDKVSNYLPEAVEGASEGQEGNWSKAFYDGLNATDKKTSIRDLTSNLTAIYNASRKTITQLYEEALPKNLSKSLEVVPKSSALQIGDSLIQEIKQNSLDKLQSSGVSKILLNDLESLGSKINKSETTDEIHEALRNYATDLDRNIKFDTIPTAAQRQDQAVLGNIRQLVRGNLKDPDVWGQAAHHFAEASDAYTALRASRDNFEKTFMKKERSLTGQIRKIVDPGKVQSFFNQFNNPTSDLKKEYLNNFLNQTEQLAQKNESVLGFEAAKDEMAQHVSSLKSKNAELGELAERLTDQAHAPQSFLTQALEAGVAHHVGISEPIIGSALAAYNGYKLLQNPYKVGQYAAIGIKGLRKLGEAIESVNNNITKASKTLIQDPHSVASLKVLQKTFPYDFDHMQKQIRKYATNDQALNDHTSKATGTLTASAPITSGLVTNKINLLNSLLSMNLPTQNAQYIFQSPMAITKAQKYDFMDKVKLLNNPFEIYRKIANGTLSQKHIHILQTFSPKLYSEMQTEVASHLTNQKANHFNLNQKQSLSRFLGYPLSQNLTGKSLLSFQNALSLQGPQNADKQLKSTKTRISGLNKLTLSQSRLLPYQQRDMANKGK